MPDGNLVSQIAQLIEDSPFHGEGYRKMWARLRHKRVFTSQERVRRLMREHNLSAWLGQGTPRGSKAHDGTIIPQTIDTMWGRDMTTTVTLEEGQAAIFIAYDHCSGECVGIHAQGPEPVGSSRANQAGCQRLFWNSSGKYRRRPQLAA